MARSKMAKAPDNDPQLDRLKSLSVNDLGRELLARLEAMQISPTPGVETAHTGKDEPATDFERVLAFLRKAGEPQTTKAIMTATGVSRSSLSQVLYITHKDFFQAGIAVGYAKRTVWSIRPEAGAAEESKREEAAIPPGRPTLFGVEGDLAGVDAADCCFRILRDSGNKATSVLTLTRLALERGYKARTKGLPDEILFATAKSFWARLGRDRRFKKVRPFVYVLRGPEK